MKTFYTIWQRVVRCFVAGVVAILPLAITVAIVIWVANFIAGFIGPDTVIGSWLKQIGAAVDPAKSILPYAMGWAVVLAAVFALGIVLELGAKKLIERSLEGIVKRIPLLGSLYSTSKQMVQMMDQKDDDLLKGMSPVYVYFGKDHGGGVLALLVSPDKFLVNDREMQIVIVPTAPVPFGGGLLFAPAENVSPINMTIDGLMSIYVSMGVTAPNYLPSVGGLAKATGVKTMAAKAMDTKAVDVKSKGSTTDK